MALGVLEIMFIVMSVVSAFGIAVLYLAKDPKLKNGVFYFLAIWGMGIAFINATRFPSNYLNSQLIAWGFGFLALVGFGTKIVKPEKIEIAKFLVTSSIILGMGHLFFF